MSGKKSQRKHKKKNESDIKLTLEKKDEITALETPENEETEKQNIETFINETSDIKREPDEQIKNNRIKNEEKNKDQGKHKKQKISEKEEGSSDEEENEIKKKTKEKISNDQDSESESSIKRTKKCKNRKEKKSHKRQEKISEEENESSDSESESESESNKKKSKKGKHKGKKESHQKHKKKSEEEDEFSDSESESESESESSIKRAKKHKNRKEKKSQKRKEKISEEENESSDSESESNKKKGKKGEHKRKKESHLKYKKISKKENGSSDSESEYESNKAKRKKVKHKGKKESHKKQKKSSEEEEGDSDSEIESNQEGKRKVHGSSDSESCEERKTKKCQKNSEKKKNLNISGHDNNNYNRVEDSKPAPEIKKSKKTYKKMQNKESDSSDSIEIIQKNNDELVKKLEERMKSINQISDFLDDSMTEIESFKGHQELKDLIKKFKLLYYPYKNIRRFAIPVIGCVSSGKSTILNYLLRLRKILQMAQEITTKCICIIRHQKGIKKAKIYEVEIKRRGGKTDGFYNFEKGKEIGDNVAEVIAERNELIANNKVGFDYEKYFLIIECEIPFFVGEMDKYAELFEFMDVPGLNEKSDITETSETGEKKSSSIGSGFYFRQIFPLIKNNIKFSLFIFSVDNYDSSNAKEILKEYINGKNKGNNSKQQKYSNNNSSVEARQYDEIIRKKEIEMQEQRDFCSLKSFHESIFILNKIDTIPQNGREKTNEEFKAHIENMFKDDKFIKLNDENEIPVMGKQLNEQISKNDSFKEYIDYYNSNSKEYEDHSNCFYEYIIELMNKEFGLNLKIEKTSSEEESEHNEEEEENENERPSYMKKEDFIDYNELKEKVGKNDDFTNFLTKKDYCKLKKIFKKNKNSKNKNNSNNNITIENLLSNKMKKVIDDFFLIDTYIEMKSKIISDFKIDPNKNNKKLIKEKLEKMINNSKGIGNPKQSIKDFYKYIQKIYSFDSRNNTIKKISSEYNTIQNYLENSSAARFLLLGPHNSGKSSIVLNIIGYNQNFLPVKTQECTKIGVIIKYANKGENVKLYETHFQTNENGLNYFEYNEKCPIAQGEDSVLQKIDQLNNDPNAKSCLKFFLIKSPIEFLDQMEDLSEEKKKSIELIDFPGLDTEFDEAQKRAKDLLKIIDGFIYVNFNITFDSGNQEILTLMYKTIRQRNNFSFNTCLFILNKIDIIQKVDLNEIMKKILDVFDKENEELPSWKVLEQKERIGDKSISLSKFSSKRYKEYKEFEEVLLNFEKFIGLCAQNNKKKSSDYEKSMNPLKLFQDENILTIIINNMEKNYFDKINLKKLDYGETYFDDYMKRLKKIIKIKNPDEKKMEKIVKLYLYIMKKRKNLKKYKISYIDTLLDNFKDVINNTLKFFEEKQQSDVLAFISYAYENLNALLHIIKLRMKDENINIFQQLNKDEIIDSIDREMSKIQNDISFEFESTKRIIDTKISNCSSNQASFNTMVSDNNIILNELIEKIKNKSIYFDKFLKEVNEKIINKLNLRELQKEKNRFKEKIDKLEKLKIDNSVSSSSDTYVKTSTQTYTTGFWFWEEKHTKTIYDHQSTINNYREKINNFIKEGKENSSKMIKDNKNKIVYNIHDIFNKFNEGISGFKKNINDFEKTVKDVEEFIYRQTGIQ